MKLKRVSKILLLLMLLSVFFGTLAASAGTEDVGMELMDLTNTRPHPLKCRFL